MSTVVGVFSRRDDAESAASDLRGKGFGSEEISLLAKEERAGAGEHGERRTEGTFGRGGATTGGGVTGGTVTGGAVGGTAGLLAGVGALAIPGIGPVVAAGPLAATLAGALTGGLVGGLIDMGIPEHRGKYYEGKLKEGNVLAVVKTESHRADEVSRVLRDHGARDVEVH